MWKSRRIEGMATLRTVLSSDEIIAAMITMVRVTQRFGSSSTPIESAMWSRVMRARP